MYMAARKQIDEMRISATHLALLSDSLREAMLHALVPLALTPRELAQRLAVPQTRLYHHLKRLHDAGLIFVERRRRTRGVVEHAYRASAIEFRLDRETFSRSRSSKGKATNTLLDFVFAAARTEIGAALDAGMINLAVTPPAVDALIAYRIPLRVDARTHARLAQRIHALYVEMEQIARESSVSADHSVGVVLSLYPIAGEITGGKRQ